MKKKPNPKSKPKPVDAPRLPNWPPRMDVADVRIKSFDCSGFAK